MRSKNIFLILISLFVLLSVAVYGCGVAKNTAASEVPEARKALEKYFQCRNDKDAEGLLSVITSDDNNETMNSTLSKLDYIKAQSIEYISDESVRNKYLEMGRGSQNGTKPENLQAFTVKYEVKYNTPGPQDDGTYDEVFYLIRTNDNKSWRIDDHGHI